MRSTKRMWTAQEDSFLSQCVKTVETKNWVQISGKLNQKFNSDFRSPKQCRERYINHCSTDDKQPFSNLWKEVDISNLFDFYAEFGSRWTYISQLFDDKSENIVKNKFYCSLRKFVRKINKYQKQSQNKYKKDIKYESVMRILDSFDSFEDMPALYRQWGLSIRTILIKLAKDVTMDKQLINEDMEWIISNLNQFNLQTRSYKSKKSKPHDKDRVSTMTSNAEIEGKNRDECLESEIKFIDSQIGSKQQISVEDLKYEKSWENLDQWDIQAYSGIIDISLREELQQVQKQIKQKKQSERQDLVREIFPDQYQQREQKFLD